MTIRNRMVKYVGALTALAVTVPAQAVTDYAALSTAADAEIDAAIAAGLVVATVAIAFLAGFKLIKRVVKGF